MNRNFLKHAARDVLCLILVFACVVAFMGAFGSWYEPKHPKTTYVPPPSERISNGLWRGALAGAAVGALVGSGVVSIRLAKNKFPTT